MGRQSMQANTTGSHNVAVGRCSLKANTTANSNVAIGTESLDVNTTGADNTAVGTNSLGAHTTGANNAALGSGSGSGITTGSSNSTFGGTAGRQITTGGNNTSIGREAGLVLTTGSYNIALGANSTHSGTGVAREIVIAYDETGKGSDTAFLDGSSGVFNKANATAWSQTSDRRIKKNIVDNNTGLDKISQIQVRNFEYRTLDEITDFGEHKESAVVKKEGIQVGAIAQEIEEVLPELVTTQTTGVKTVNPDKLTWYMINAIKELTDQNKEMKAEIDELKKK
jgi:hypothetical protein